MPSARSNPGRGQCDEQKRTPVPSGLTSKSSRRCRRRKPPAYQLTPRLLLGARESTAHAVHATSLAGAVLTPQSATASPTLPEVRNDHVGEVPPQPPTPTAEPMRGTTSRPDNRIGRRTRAQAARRRGTRGAAPSPRRGWPLRPPVDGRKPFR